MNYLSLILSLALAVLVTTTSGFVQQASLLKQSSPVFSQGRTPALFVTNEDDDFPPDESTEYSGSVDWDAEWKKVVEKDGQLESGAERPGKDFYKSEAEIAAIKAANTATQTVSESANTVANSLPDMGSMSGDWRFWIGIIALISVGLSLLSAPPDITSGLSDDSFYV